MRGSGVGEVVVVEVEVQQIDVPGRLDAIGHVGRDDLARDRQRRRLRVVVDVAVAGREQLRVLLVEQAREERRSRTCRRPATPVSGSSSVSRAPLCSHSQRMLSRISPVAMSSIR